MRERVGGGEGEKVRESESGRVIGSEGESRGGGEGEKVRESESGRVIGSEGESRGGREEVRGMRRC